MRTDWWVFLCLEDLSFEVVWGWCSERLHLVVLTAIVLAYVSYYCGWVVSKPKVVGQGWLKDRLMKSCPILSQNYWPTIWAFSCHCSTLLRVLLQKRPSISYKREIFTLSDGGEVALDWGVLNKSDEPTEAADLPVLLLLPGVVGNSKDNYMQHLAEDGLLEGYRAVVFNQRGTSGVKLKTFRTYSGSDISDLFDVVQHIQMAYPGVPIVGLGVSLGGMILTQYLHRLGEECDLHAVIAVSAAWEPSLTRKSLEDSLFNKMVYSKAMTTGIKTIVRSNLEQLTAEQREKLPVDLTLIMNAKVVSDFDTLVTAPLFGFSSLEDYYKSCKNADKIHKIRKPFVCITSADDPFVPEKSLPFEEFERNPNTVMVVTSHGGHFGFVEGLYPCKKTWLDRVMQQLLITLKQEF